MSAPVDLSEFHDFELRELAERIDALTRVRSLIECDRLHHGGPGFDPVYLAQVAGRLSADDLVALEDAMRRAARLFLVALAARGGQLPNRLDDTGVLLELGRMLRGLPDEVVAGSHVDGLPENARLAADDCGRLFWACLDEGGRDLPDEAVVVFEDLGEQPTLVGDPIGGGA